MKKLFIIGILSLVVIIGCKKHSEPIKWEKPGDELVGEWVWSKGTMYYSKDYIWEKTDLGAFRGMPDLKMVGLAVFNIDGTTEMITELTRTSDTLNGKWSVKSDTLKITFDKDGRTVLVKYKVEGDKFIIDNLKTPKTIEEYSRD